MARGTVFKITPQGTLTTLYSFDGSDGGTLCRAGASHATATSTGRLQAAGPTALAPSSVSFSRAHVSFARRRSEDYRFGIGSSDG